MLRIRIGKGNQNHQLKVLKHRLQKLLLSKLVHSLTANSKPPFQCLHTSSHVYTHEHTHMHARTQTAGCAVLPGTLRERRRALQAIPSPPRPLPLSPSGRDDRLIILHVYLCSSENRAPAGQPSSQVSPPQPPCVRGTGGRSQPPGSRLRRPGPNRPAGWP